MEVGRTAEYDTGNGTVMDKDGKSPKSVNFEQGEDQADGRKKYLTAKYGSHQMALIRKRLHVEMWLLEEIAKLYRSGDPAGAAPEKELDLDELLDLDDDASRRVFLQRFLQDAAAAPDAVTRFIEELLVQAKKL
ncbi:Protein phosphatase 1 regulatory subunit 14B [Amphibalanus amphitrite]|uniref:Protein phosphatase 1 regulatory subunit 14B n=2 Tax=Amphibalanus amphitrite TaxID=1232801 RepID=A0A6A4X8M8_AMPAM|nr:protein phosphatase 1 regulatory subunit 14C-like isoform X1 [Amphibalanus amphitrite]XP_043202316.1 protein phosphatase 1 regulatory subunit 14C-like isoform X1 [Amphibalanus amphitrite]XP_043202317.1 protein phosphatase 1 regulatory subunit 14C-like isoform X1 [Amphibalanus amphitrite]XP_043226159.1 protein phosphatase 1 regulatory subunit 14C-like isoform X2 [Amphibalanus amphitrite]XP_043226160.1 protein phosphatase 1 regulatory subunit 14C-like isoform X2 [Amphibalanus amphitrite]XP_04